MKHIFRVTKEIADVRGDDGYARFYVNTDTDRASLMKTEPEEIVSAVLDAWDAIPIPDQEARIKELEEQNAMLTECLLEISEIIYD